MELAIQIRRKAQSCLTVALSGGLRVYVRDDRPFGGADPPAVLFRGSRNRSSDHPEKNLRSFTGILQVGAYAGYNRLLEPDRQPRPIVEALCWAHAAEFTYIGCVDSWCR